MLAPDYIYSSIISDISIIPPTPMTANQPFLAFFALLVAVCCSISRPFPHRHNNIIMCMVCVCMFVCTHARMLSCHVVMSFTWCVHAPPPPPAPGVRHTHHRPYLSTYAILPVGVRRYEYNHHIIYQVLLLGKSCIIIKRRRYGRE